MPTQILALVGAAGGVGTTRLTVECGATLARADWDVAIFDAAYTTQGLSRYIEGSIEQDITTLVTGETTLENALYDVELDVPGTLAICPARAPFERNARAKTAGAAERFEQQLAAASLSHDAVLVDTPPLGSNQAVSAVNAAERCGIVTVDTERGADALATTRQRLADVGQQTDLVIANRAGQEAVEGTQIPTSNVTRARASPACVPPEETFAPAIAEITQELTETELDLSFAERKRLGGFIDR